MKTSEYKIDRMLNEIFGDKAIVPQLSPIYRLDGPQGKRFYFKVEQVGKKTDIVISESVTTIIKKYTETSPYLIDWIRKNGEKADYVANEARHYGTLIHIVFGNLIRGKSIEMSREKLSQIIDDYVMKSNIREWEFNRGAWIIDMRSDILGFIQWHRDYRVRPIALEYVFVNKFFSGTIDYVCTIEIKKGERFPAIIDFKSGRNQFYIDGMIQLAGYREGWNLEHPNYPIERIFNYGCASYRFPVGKAVIPYRFEEQTDSKYAQRWPHILAMNTMETKDEPKAIKFFDVNQSMTVNLDTDIDKAFVVIDPIEEVLLKKRDQEIDEQVDKMIRDKKKTKAKAKGGKHDASNVKNRNRRTSGKTPGAGKNKMRGKNK